MIDVLPIRFLLTFPRQQKGGRKEEEFFYLRLMKKKDDEEVMKILLCIWLDYAALGTSEDVSRSLAAAACFGLVWAMAATATAFAKSRRRRENFFFSSVAARAT